MPSFDYFPTIILKIQLKHANLLKKISVYHFDLNFEHDYLFLQKEQNGINCGNSP